MDEKNFKKLPLGLSDFRKIIEGDYVYVDKTQLIHQMITGGEYYFISRPRRFGKSLLVSTLAELFSGNKELFKNLWIGQSNYTWPQYPVIRFDFSTMSTLSADELKHDIIDTLEEIAADYGVDIAKQQTITGKFKTLIKKLASKERVVILADEYDKPILDHIDNVQEACAYREVLKSLYIAIKGSDSYIRFVLLTGVSKFAQTSIFSGLNNLEEISLDVEYATLLGYTEKELKKYFVPHVARLGKKDAIDSETVVDKLRKNYNGYLFAFDSVPMFNPFSVLNCLKKKKWVNFWFGTGTPSFLIKLIKTGQYSLDRVYQPVMSTNELGAFEPESVKINALLYQTGYLTIKKYDPVIDVYTLDFPNYEVASAFNLLVSTSFTQLTEDQTKNYAAQILQTFARKDMAELQAVLQNFFNEMPYNVHIKREFDLHIIIFSVFKLIGIEVDPEVVTSLGRADLVVSLPKLVYVIELKFNGSAAQALEQIKDKKYYEKYENTGKQITLIGINFDEPTKTVSLEACGV